jgi:hypothetical protein
MMISEQFDGLVLSVRKKHFHNPNPVLRTQMRMVTARRRAQPSPPAMVHSGVGVHRRGMQPFRMGTQKGRGARQRYTVLQPGYTEVWGAQQGHAVLGCIVGLRHAAL